MQFTALLAIVVTIAVVWLGYRFYASRMDREIMKTDPKKATPATMYNDGVDFMPASSSVLFGYQFKSIAALGPIVGPITALQFGWLPSIAWLIVGVFFIGWVQDYASALMSMRNEGMTMGGLSYKLISPRARTLLLVFMYVYLLLIMAAFGAQIAPILARTGVPFGFLSIVGAGILAGQMTYRWKQNLLLTTVVTVGVALFGAWLGTTTFFTGTGADGQPLGVVTWINRLAGDPETGVLYQTPYPPNMLWSTFLWALVIMLFCYLGSVLPIWRFAQPINYTSFWFVAISLVLSVVGILLATFGVTLTGAEAPATSFQIPAFVTAFQPHLGPIWPLLFVTIACGAISGWHSLVSTSGTARQLERETDVLPVGAGAMYTEAVLGVLAVIMGATLVVGTATVGDAQIQALVMGQAGDIAVYNPAQDFRMLVLPAGVFAHGMARFMGVLGLEYTFGFAIGSIFLTVMALTVMQLVLRFMRIASAELLGDRIPAFKNPHVGSIVAIAIALFLVYVGYWNALWLLFGASNQLFAGLALLLISIWLIQQGKSYNWVFIPGLFMYATTVAALLWTAYYRFKLGFIDPMPATFTGSPIAFQLAEGISVAVGLFMAICAIILFVDAWQAYTVARTKKAPAGAAAD